MRDRRATSAWRKPAPRMLAWALLGVLLTGVVWFSAVGRAADERQRAEETTLASVAAAAQAYEQYLTRSVAQMDQVSMQLAQSWEQSDGRLDLAALGRSGMFLDRAFACVAIVDTSGATRTAIHRNACPASLAGSLAFLHHKGNNTSALRIGPPPQTRGAAHAFVLFTRRLETPDGSFAGLVLLGVRPSFFTDFYLSAPGQGGMVAMAGADTSLRVERGAGDGLQQGHTRFPAGQELWDASVAGARVVAGKGGFPDGQARMLGWRHSSAYPVVGLVAMARDAALAPAEANWQASRRTAVAATVVLLVLTVLAMLVSRRAALRYRAREDIRIAYRTATEGANDGFYMAAPVHGPDGAIVDFEIVDCNERGARFYGIGRAAMIGKRISGIDGKIFGDKLFDAYLAAMEHGLYEDERQMPEQNRRNIVWGHRRIVRVGNSLAITLQDISERKAHAAELKRLSNEDVLTGLPNRQWLIDYLPSALAQARTEAALLFIDLDDFKLFNDAHGHPAGDELLRAAAQRLRSLLRPDDVLVRFGSDEFVALLMPSETGIHSERVAARIVSAFAASFAVGGSVAQVGASVGISSYPRDAREPDELIRNADIAMESAKTEGKGQYRAYTASLARSVQSRLQLKQGLLDAIEQEQFVLYYQPRVNAQTGELASMEALLRWLHPVQGLISPLDFIPLAESSGLILRIGALVMDQACAQLSAWRGAGLPLVPVSINVSPKQFALGEVHLELAACLARHNIAPALLEVEITESAMMGDQDHIIAQLDAIRALGVKLHVDDFGTGYSSLSQLQKLRMDVLKVDRAFTSELDNSREGKVFFQAIVSMAHALGMAVVAEGVETASQLAILQQLACNEVQGYHIARPMPAADMQLAMRRRFLFPAVQSSSEHYSPADGNAGGHALSWPSGQAGP